MSLSLPAGVGQGIRRSIFSISAILGPLWAGGAVAFDTYYILFGVPLGLLVLVMVGLRHCVGGYCSARNGCGFLNSIIVMSGLISGTLNYEIV